MDILERVTSFAIAMFLLSLIVEKLANFWKLHGPEKIRGKQDDPDHEKAREMSIGTATLVTGLLVVLVFKADAIQILRSPTPQQALGWDFVFADTDSIKADATLSKMTISYFGSLHMKKGSSYPVLFVISVLLLASAFVLVLMSIAMRNPAGGKLKERLDKFEQKRNVSRIYVFITIGLFLLPAIVAYRFAAWADCSQQFWAYLSLFVGIIISGAGISFGSKFWHDLLDMLFEVKNLWGKARNEETYKQKSLQEFDDYILSPATDDVMKLCLEQYGESLKSRPGVTGISIGTSVRNGRKVKSLHVHLKDSNIYGIGNELSVTLPDGKKIQVPVEVFENVGTAVISVGPGALIASKATKEFTGTFGCILADADKKYVLTCSHVLDGGHSTNYRGDIAPGKLSANNKDTVLFFENQLEHELGKWVYGFRNNAFDIALVELEKSFNLVQNLIGNVRLAPARAVTLADVEKKTPVELIGAQSQRQSGVIVSMASQMAVFYELDQTEITFQNLLAIAREDNGNWRTISQKGDSGAVIVDKNDNKVLGMIIAGNDRFSYGIPMTSILDLLNMKVV